MLTVIGVVLGLGSAFGVMRLMSSLLFNVNAGDPLTYGTVSIGLLVTCGGSRINSQRAESASQLNLLSAELRIPTLSQTTRKDEPPRGYSGVRRESHSFSQVTDLRPHSARRVGF